MTYQLVIQAREDTLADHDVLVAMEDRLISALGLAGDVDGHDVGAGEANIYIIAQDPVDAFERARGVLTDFGVLDKVRVAYRPVGEHLYTLLWPPKSQDVFEIL